MIKVNEYFDGKVKSLGFKTANGSATAGVMVKGEFEFSTSSKEIMLVTEGKMTVKLPGQSDWKTFTANQKFEVEANNKFQVKIEEDTSYICYY